MTVVTDLGGRVTPRRPAVEAGPRKPRLRSLIDPAAAGGQAGGKSVSRHNTDHRDIISDSLESWPP